MQPASQSMLHGLLPQVVALLAAGYQCSSNLMLALDPTRQAEQPGEGNVGSLFCFDPSVSAWARVAAERHNTSVSRQHTNSSPWEIDNEVDYGHHGRQGGALGAPGSSTTSDTAFTLKQVTSVPAVKRLPAEESSLSSNSFGAQCLSLSSLLTE